MSERYAIALDQGTTSSRAALVDHDGHIVDTVQHEFKQICPQPGWVERNPSDILFTQLGSMAELLTRHQLSAAGIVGIGITNQRETCAVWDRVTGEPVTQCNRVAMPSRRADCRRAVR